MDLKETCEKHTEAATSPPNDVRSLDIESGVSNGQRHHWLIRWLWKENRSTPASNPRTSDTEDQYAVETTSLEEIPRGYPQVATFLSSDRNFLQFRAFGELHCRILCDLQYEVGRLEQELQELDKFDMQTKEGKRRLNNRRRDVDKTQEQMAADGYPDHIKRSRSKVFMDLRQAVKEYDEFLLRSKEMLSLQKPSNRDYESVRTWFRDKNPLVFNEGKFIKRKEDIVTLRTGRESAGFDSFVERCLTRMDVFLREWLRCRIIERIFLTPELRDKTSMNSVRYYAPGRIDKLVNILITIVVFVLLVLPVIVMYEVTNIRAQSPLDAIGVLIVFTLIFGMAISALTTARRHELFGASAAYAAVLVVFIGNFGVQQVSIVPASV